MKLRLKRLKHNDTTTIGILFVDGKFECLTLEDEPRLQKVYGKTRIPSGIYTIKFREAGRIYEKYKEKYSWFSGGIPHLQEVPNFSYIYIHIGNTHLDTLGCILVGDGMYPDGSRLTASTQAFKRLYSKITKEEDITIDIEDET